MTLAGPAVGMKQWSTWGGAPGGTVDMFAHNKSGIAYQDGN
jgi:hypothetical protein